MRDVTNFPKSIFHLRFVFRSVNAECSVLFVCCVLCCCAVCFVLCCVLCGSGCLWEQLLDPQVQIPTKWNSNFSKNYCLKKSSKPYCNTLCHPQNYPDGDYLGEDCEIVGSFVDAHVRYQE